MGDQDPSPPVSRRALLTGGVAAALTATAAGTVPTSEEDADALRPFNYPSGGHGDWWPAYVAHAGGPEHPDRHYHYVRDQLIVAQDDLSALRKGLRRRAGVEVGSSLDELGLALVRLQQPRASVPDLVDELQAGRDPTARWAAPNYVLGPCSHLHMSGSIPQPTTESLPPPPAVGSRPGEGVAISLLDSGALLDHAWFAGRVAGEPERAELDQLGRLHCNAGHGTFVAGVLLTHAPGARVRVDRVFDRNWIVDDFTMAGRLRALASSDVQVLTMPFGGYSHDDLGMLATSAALRYLFDRRPDLVAVAGAGNDATNKPYFPAADRRVIAVGAVQRDGSRGWRRACFSNYGPWVDASAPGVNVLSAFLHYEGPMIPREVLAQCIGRLGGGSHALGSVHRLGSLEWELVRGSSGRRGHRLGHRRGTKRSRCRPSRPRGTRGAAHQQPGHDHRPPSAHAALSTTPTRSHRAGAAQAACASYGGHHDGKMGRRGRYQGGFIGAQPAEPGRAGPGSRDPEPHA